MSMKVHRMVEGGLVKSWEPEGDRFDMATWGQLGAISSMPFIHKHVAAMPDAHFGMGATVGSVVATKRAVIPAAVGVDIGCGMMAWRTTLTANDLPDSLGHIRSSIERMVPHGRTGNGKRGRDQGGWVDIPKVVERAWVRDFQHGYELLAGKHPKAIAMNNINHLGTLGTGNHFIEVCLDENDDVWVMLHSGSRGLGNKIGQYFIERAKEEMKRWFINVPDVNLSYFPQGSELYDDYIEAMSFAQEFAWVSREIMMRHTLAALQAHLPPFTVTEEAINCHHNYATMENHFGENVLVTRKGAVRAREGDLGIIPGSMGTGSFIVRGRGNKESFCSCSHGAGRRMSRTKAKQEISLAEHVRAMEGIEARTDEGVIDESPRAYKDISQVIAAQSDLIEVVHTLRQVINVKG